MKISSSPFLQNLIYGAILMAVGLTFYGLRPTPVYLPHGIFLPAEATSNTLVQPNEVEWMDALPESATPLGNISVLTHFESTNPEEINSILMTQKSFVQALAASHGANGVAVNIAGLSPGGPSPLDGVQMNVTAFK